MCELTHPAGSVTIYLDRERDLRRAIRAKIHPETSGEMLEAIEAVQGLSIEPNFFPPCRHAPFSEETERRQRQDRFRSCSRMRRYHRL
jgi:hypothetical protein